MQHQSQIRTSMTPGQWTLLITLSVLWGGSFFFVEIAIGTLSPLTVVTARVGIATALLNVGLILMRRPLPATAKIWGAFLVMGLLNNAIPFLLIAWGQTAIASGLAAILNATTPLFTALLAHVLTRDERLTGLKMAGIALGFVGCIVMLREGGLSGGTLARGAVLAGAISYALAGIYGRRFRAMGVTPAQSAAGQVTASTLLLVPILIITSPPWGQPFPEISVIAAVIGLGALSTALAYVIYFRLLAAVGATNLLLVTFLIPVSAILLGTLVLAERLSGAQIAGMGLIGLGLVAIDGRLIRKRS